MFESINIALIGVELMFQPVRKNIETAIQILNPSFKKKKLCYKLSLQTPGPW